MLLFTLSLSAQTGLFEIAFDDGYIARNFDLDYEAYFP